MMTWVVLALAVGFVAVIASAVVEIVSSETDYEEWRKGADVQDWRR